MGIQTPRRLAGSGNQKRPAPVASTRLAFFVVSSVASPRSKRNGETGWQRPTLPHRYQCSTIGACGLNCRVRDGSGCTPTALATNTLSPVSSGGMYACLPSTSSALTTPLRSMLRSLRLPASPRASVSLSQSTISIGSLQPSLAFHVRPIQHVVSMRSQGEPHLEAGFPLRCFQRFSAPEFATRLCHWRDNRHTSAPSIPVLSY
jgi:hypothetical protein